MEDEARRRILRQATLYTWGLAAAAVVVGALGSAGIAWLVLPELPFLLAWLLVFALVMAGAGILGAVRWTLARRQAGRSEAIDVDDN